MESTRREHDIKQITCDNDNDNDNDNNNNNNNTSQKKTSTPHLGENVSYTL